MRKRIEGEELQTLREPLVQFDLERVVSAGGVVAVIVAKVKSNPATTKYWIKRAAQWPARVLWSISLEVEFPGSCDDVSSRPDCGGIDVIVRPIASETMCPLAADIRGLEGDSVRDLSLDTKVPRVHRRQDLLGWTDVSTR